MSSTIEKISTDDQTLDQCVEEPKAESSQKTEHLENILLPLVSSVQSHTAQMRNEIEQWTALLNQDQMIEKLTSKSLTDEASADDILTADQKFFIDARTDGAEFLDESFDFRKKFLFYAQVLQANAEKTREEKTQALDEITIEHVKMYRHMTKEPFLGKSPTK